jgi:hypothetical protein
LKKRELSQFMVQEMLFDYATGELDSELSQNVKNEIEKSKSLQDELFQIKTGLGYFNHMHDIKISTLLIEEIKTEKSYFQQIKNSLSFSQWPPIVKWTIEAFMIIFVVVLMTVLTPWGRVKEFIFRESQTELILAEVTKKNNTEAIIAAEIKDGELKKSGEPFEDEETPQAVVVSNPSVLPIPPVKITKATPVKKSAAVEETKKQGFVYRGTATIVNAQAGAIKLKSKIVEFGGRKAGEVELGWRRNQGDYYFHFTIPESRYEELQDYAKTLGGLKISQDPHPRVMPSGIIRIILTAEESQN